MADIQTINEAIDRVEANTDKTWFDTAYGFGEQLAATGQPFRADDIWDMLGDNKPHRNDAMGAIFRTLKKNKLIKKAELPKLPAKAVTNHRDQTIWTKF